MAHGLNPADKGYAAAEVFAGHWVHVLIKWLAIEGNAACVVGELACRIVFGTRRGGCRTGVKLEQENNMSICGTGPIGIRYKFAN